MNYRFNLAVLLGLSAAVVLTPFEVFGVVVSTTKQNTTAPPDDPGWANIAVVDGSVVSNATGIYLGNRWMLTARHNGPGPVTFPELGKTFEPNLATVVSIRNPVAGLSEFTDLTVYQLREDPGLPSLKLAQNTPKPATEILVIGNGRDRADEPTFWDAQEDGEIVDWLETTEEDSNYVGYKTENDNVLRWGTNLIEGDSLVEGGADANNTVTIFVENSLDVIATLSEFDLKGSRANERIRGPDREPATEFESQAVLNDSGGAMFMKEDDEWVLAGVMLAVSGFNDQPDASVTAIHGNATFYADIATYRSAIIGELNILGDFDDDGLLTAADIDLLAAAIDSDNLDFDLTTDGAVDEEDHRFWIEELRYTFYGDANLDGEFNTSDMVSAFRNALYETGQPATWESGDWNGDGQFNSRDFVIALQSASFEKGPRISSVATHAVPEPASLAMFGLLIVLASTRRLFRI